MICDIDPVVAIPDVIRRLRVDLAVAAIIAYDRAMWHQAEDRGGIYVGTVELKW